MARALLVIRASPRRYIDYCTADLDSCQAGYRCKCKMANQFNIRQEHSPNWQLRTHNNQHQTKWPFAYPGIVYCIMDTMAVVNCLPVKLRMLPRPGPPKHSHACTCAGSRRLSLWPSGRGHMMDFASLYAHPVDHAGGATTRRTESHGARHRLAVRRSSTSRSHQSDEHGIPIGKG